MEKQTKRKFIPNVYVGDSGPDPLMIRRWVEKSPETFMARVSQMADEGKLTFHSLGNLRDLFRALASVKIKTTMEDIGGVKRAVEASAFPILTGTLMIAAINEAYMQVPTIGGQLVTEIDDNKSTTTMAAIHSLDNQVDEVKDTENFPEIGTDEEKITILHKRNGRKLTIRRELIEENEVADIVSRINALGQIAANRIEDQTLYRVTDYDGSKASPSEPYVYRPNGSGTALYSATANTPGTRAPNGTRINSNALTDETDLDALRTRMNGFRDANNRRIYIPWSEVVVLVPDALLGTLLKIINSEYVPGVVNEMNNYGPRGRFRISPENVVSSPRMDDMSTGAWYGGAFRRQFVRKWKLRFEYVTLGQDTQAFLDSRIAFQARIAWDVEVGATDYCYVVQSLAATTAPADE